MWPECKIMVEVGSNTTLRVEGLGIASVSLRLIQSMGEKFGVRVGEDIMPEILSRFGYSAKFVGADPTTDSIRYWVEKI
jgi:hypothetical protein